jgi:hypothetical protein
VKSSNPEFGASFSPRHQRGVAAALAFQIVLLFLAASQNRDLLNTDAIAYLRIASYYAKGPSHLMVSGYWGPLLSWITAPLLALDVSPLIAARIVMGFSAVVFWSGCLAVFIKFRLPPIGTLLGAWIVAASSVFWSVEYISPDLLVAGLVTLAISTMFSQDWVTGRVRPALTGVLWGLAYLAKAVAAPLAFLVSLGMATLWIITGTATARNMARSSAISLGVFVLLISPWIIVLSFKYNGFTLSTSAKIAHAIAGPRDVERYHPFGRMFHRPEPGRITSWEDPSLMPYRYWSPFENTKYAAHQLTLIMGNLQTITRLLSDLDALSLGSLALLGCLIIPKPRRQRLAEDRWRWSIIPAICLVAIYLPMPVQGMDTRYFYVLYPFLWIAGVGVARWVTSQISRFSPWVLALSLVAVSFALPAVVRVAIALEGIPDPASHVAKALAEKLRAAQIRGPIAGSGLIAGGRTGLYLAFLMNEPWYGDEVSPTVAALKRSGARLFVIARRHPLTNQLKSEPVFKDLDGLLFSSREEAEQFPLKVFQLSVP